MAFFQLLDDHISKYLRSTGVLEGTRTPGFYVVEPALIDPRGKDTHITSTEAPHRNGDCAQQGSLLASNISSFTASLIYDGPGVVRSGCGIGAHCLSLLD